MKLTQEFLEKNIGWMILLIVLVVSVLSGFYPALIAMRVTPVEAMAADD